MSTTKTGEVNWSAPLPDFMSSFPQLAREVAENIALAVTARMCRKGMGWKFPRGVYVDPRMRDAEYEIDKEAEAYRIDEVLEKIEKEIPVLERPSSLLAFHAALRDAWAEFAEPDDGTPVSKIGIAHKSLDKKWFSDYSECFGTARAYLDLWTKTLEEIGDESPPQDALKTLLEFDLIFKEGQDLLQTPVGKLLAQANIQGIY